MLNDAVDEKAVSFPSKIWFHPNLARSGDPDSGEACRSDAPTCARSPDPDQKPPFLVEGALSKRAPVL